MNHTRKLDIYYLRFNPRSASASAGLSDNGLRLDPYLCPLKLPPGDIFGGITGCACFSYAISLPTSGGMAIVSYGPLITLSNIFAAFLGALRLHFSLIYIITLMILYFTPKYDKGNLTDYNWLKSSDNSSF